MKKIGIIIGVIFLFLFGFGSYLMQGEQNVGGLASPNIRVISTASTTVFTVGHQLSSTVLSQATRRMYASICNNTSGQRGYLRFSGTAITGTTTASVLLAAGSCYEIDQDNPYVGAVQFIQETGSTTNSLMVTELRY